MLNAEEVYELIGLNEIERKIYETIVGLGAKTIEELTLYTGDSLPEVQSNLIALEQKGLIRRISGKVDILVAMEPRIVLSEKVEDDLTQKLSNVRDTITQKWNAVKNALSSQLKGFQESTSSVINDHLEQFRKNVDLTKEQIDTISKDFGARVKSDSEKNRETITTTLKEHYTAYEKTLTELQETLFGALDKNATDFEADMKSLSEQLTQAIREQIVDWRDSVTRYQEKSETLLESTEETGAEDIEQFKKDVSEALTNLGNIYTSGFTDAKAKTEDATISSMDAFKEKLNGLLRDSSDTLNEQIRNINTHINSFKDSSETLLQSSLTEVKAVVEDLKKKNMELINKTKESISSVVDEAGAIAASLDQEKTQIEKFKKDASEEFNKQVDTFVGTEREDIVKSMNLLKEGISENLAKVFTVISSLKNDFDGLLKSHASNAEKMQQELLVVVAQTIEDTKSKANELVNELLAEQIVEEFFEGSTRLQEKFSTLAYELSDTVNSSLTDTNELIENSSNKAKRLTEESQGKINEELKANMELISQKVEESDKKDAELLTKIKNQLKDAISQVKDANQTMAKEIDGALSEMITQAKTTIDGTKEQIQGLFTTEHGKLNESNEKTQTDLLEMFSVSNEKMEKQFTEVKGKTAVHVEETSHNVLKQLEESKKQNIELMKTFIDNMLTESIQIRDEVPSVIEKELEEHKDRISQLDIRFADTLGRLLSIVEDLKTKTEEKAGSLFGLRKAGLEEFMDELASMEGELQSLKAQVRDVINTNTEAYEVGVSSLLDNISRNMTYRVETIEKDAESNFEKMDTTYEAIVSSFASTFQGAFQKEIENALESVTNGLKTNNSETKESAVLRLEENKEAINEMIYASEQILTAKLNEAKTAFEELQKTAAINTESLDEAGKQIDAQLQSNMTERKEVMTDLHDSITKTFENLRDTNLETNKSWVEQFKESFAQYEKKLVSTLIQHKMDTTTRILEEITEQDALLNTIKTNVETLTNSLRERNESSFTFLQETLKTILNEKGAEIENNNATLQEKTEEQINARKTETEQSVETLVEKIVEEKITDSQSHLMGLKQSISDIVLNVLEEITQQLSDFNSTLNAKLSETEDTFNKLSGALDDSTSTLTELDSNVTQFEPQTKALLEKLEKTIDNATELKKVTTELDKLSNSINEKVKEANDEITGIKKIIFDILEEKEEQGLQDISSIKSDFENVLEQANASVKQKVDELKDALITSGKDYLTKFDTKLEQIITRLDQLLSRPTTAVQEGSVDFKGNFSNLLSVQTTKYRENIYSSIDKINEFLENLGLEVETAAKLLNEKLSETTASQIQSYEGTVITHKDELLKIVANRVEGIEKELTDVVNVIPAELEAAVTASNKAAHVLGTIQKLSRKAEPLPVEQTYRVVGDANIIFNLKAIIDRTKANLALITPKFDDIPIDSLSDIKKTIRVTCVTEISETNIKEAEKLQERGNIRVRDYPDPKVYVISRDSEEVLIAPAVKGQKDLIGIISTNDGLIELINSELLSGYTAKSKAI
ncbi:MAG: helix-turn-helix domain-containing protein [Promethearchaeota archaeon]